MRALSLPTSVRIAPRVTPIPAAHARGTVEIARRLRGRRGLTLLDSAAGAPRDWSLILFDPLPQTCAPDSIAAARAWVERIETAPGDDVPGPFHGGFVGAFAYDLGVAGERRPVLPDDAWCSPRAIGASYCDFVVRDERGGRAWLVLGDGALDDRAPCAARRDELLALLAAPPAARATSEVDARAVGPLVRHVGAAEHRSRIESARADIAAGEYYQANLAHRYSRAVSGDPFEWYVRLRAANPAPYMALFPWEPSTSAPVATEAGLARRTERGALLSASPELLVEFDGRTARTRPIKGTAPRALDAHVDAAHAARLLASEKDRAELAMIVDLERNDLGRRARAGSVRVERFPHLESYARVHHLTADVVAEAAPGTDAFDVLAALFPGGSITGAPKLASMAAIARLEREGRGFFTGSLGFVDTRGHAAWNILIRTLVWRPDDRGAGEISFHVGGGITWLSDAADEERETLAKAAALIDALESGAPPAARRGGAP